MVVSFAAIDLDRVRRVCEAHEVPWEVLGEVSGDRLIVEDTLDLSVAELATLHYRALEPIVGA